jgi:hypothetical protein
MRGTEVGARVPLVVAAGCHAILRWERDEGRWGVESANGLAVPADTLTRHRKRAEVTFTARGGTVFDHNAGYSGDVHIAPAVGEPSVEVQIAELEAFVARVALERRVKSLRDALSEATSPERDANRRPG